MITKDTVLKVLEARNHVIYDMQDDGLDESDVEEKDFIDMIVEEVNKQK
jgi:hypothetical protein